MKDLKAGTELSCHYMIDMAEAAQTQEQNQWYLDLWDEFSLGSNRNSQIFMDIEDDDASVTSSNN